MFSSFVNIIKYHKCYQTYIVYFRKITSISALLLILSFLVVFLNISISFDKYSIFLEVLIKKFYSTDIFCSNFIKFNCRYFYNFQYFNPWSWPLVSALKKTHLGFMTLKKLLNTLVLWHKSIQPLKCLLNTLDLPCIFHKNETWWVFHSSQPSSWHCC